MPIEKGKPVFKTLNVIRGEGDEIVIASSESNDRSGDIIHQDGWVLDNFIENPQGFYAHDSFFRFPVLNWKNVKNDGKLSMAPIWADDIPDHKDAKIVKALWDRGFLKTVSVGFMPIEFKEMKDDKGNVRGTEFIKQELLEVSIVPIPANTEAHRLAMKMLGMEWGGDSIYALLRNIEKRIENMESIIKAKFLTGQSQTTKETEPADQGPMPDKAEAGDTVAPDSTDREKSFRMRLT